MRLVGPYRRRLPWIGRVPTRGQPARLLPRVAVVRPATPVGLYAGRVVAVRPPLRGQPARLLPRITVAVRRPGPPPGVVVITRPPRANPPLPPARLVRGVLVCLPPRLPYVGRSVWSSRLGKLPLPPDRRVFLAASVRTSFVLPAALKTRFNLPASVRTRFRLEAQE